MTIATKEFVGQSKIRHYKPTMSGSMRWHPALREGWLTWWDVPAMLLDPHVQIGFRVLCAPLARATWKVKCDNRKAGEWIDKTLTTFWKKCLVKAQQMLLWGSVPAEVRWDTDAQGMVEFKDLDDFRVIDTRPHVLDRKVVGFRVSGNLGLPANDIRIDLPADAKDNTLYKPRAFWLANEPEVGIVFGKSRLQAAWSPWMEKCGAHGAKDLRKLYNFKYSLNGGVMKHPSFGNVTVGGVTISCQEYAMRVMEMAESGHVMTLPSEMYPNSSQPMWEFIPATVTSGAHDINDYPNLVGDDIWLGMGVLPEVIKASQTGSGWSGRSVPFLTFLTSEDAIVNQIITAVRHWIIEPGLEKNFGDVPYDIEAESLVPKDDGGQDEPDENKSQSAKKGWETRRGGGQPQGIMGASNGRPVSMSQTEFIEPSRPWRYVISGGNVHYGVRDVTSEIVVHPHARQPLSLAQDSGKGRWITIGAKDGHGGSPVYIEGGRITKGAPGLHGKKIESLDHESPEQTEMKDRANFHNERGNEHHAQVMQRRFDETTDHPEFAHHRDEMQRHYKERDRLRDAAGDPEKKHKLADDPEFTPTHRQQMNHEREYRKSVWAKKARKEGIDKTSLYQLAGEMKSNHDEHAKDVRSMLASARESGKKLGVPLHPKQLSETGDATTIPGFDTLASELSSRYPHLLGAHGYGDTHGYDANQGEAAEKLLDYLRAGVPEAMNPEDAYEYALDYLVEQKAAQTETPEREPGENDESPRRRQKQADHEEPIPFSQQFDESKVSRDKGGKFAEQASKIPHGELHHIGGIPVRHESPGKFRVETDTGHVAGDAEKIGEHIAADHAGRELHGKARAAALERGEGPKGTYSNDWPVHVPENSKRKIIRVPYKPDGKVYAMMASKAYGKVTYSFDGGKTNDESKAAAFNKSDPEDRAFVHSGQTQSQRESGIIPASAEGDAAGFAALPKGTKVVSLDPNTHGRVGEIVKVDGVNRVKLEGTPGFASDHVEPLDEGLSWRAGKKEEVKADSQSLIEPEPDDLTDKAFFHSDRANALSEKANAGKAPLLHSEAAKAHREAAKHHYTAEKESAGAAAGAHKMEREKHRDAAGEHDAMALAKPQRKKKLAPPPTESDTADYFRQRHGGQPMLFSQSGVQLSTDAAGHEHKGAGQGGGQFASAGGTGPKLEAMPSTADEMHAKADEIAEHVSDKATSILDKFKAPGAWMRAKTGLLKTKLVEKYGPKNAALIIGAGQVLTWGITIGAPLATGLPIFVPPGGGILTSIAIAGMVELYRKVRGKTEDAA